MFNALLTLTGVLAFDPDLGLSTISSRVRFKELFFLSTDFEIYSSFISAGVYNKSSSRFGIFEFWLTTFKVSFEGSGLKSSFTGCSGASGVSSSTSNYIKDCLRLCF